MVDDPSIANRASVDAKGNPLDIVPITPEEVDAAIEAAGSKSVNQAPPRLADKRTVSEAIDGLFEGLELTEDFRSKASVLVEAFIAEERVKIRDEYAALAEEYKEEAKSFYESNLNDYLSYVANQWLAENKIAVESSLRLESADRVINSLKNILAESNIILISEEDETLVSKLQTQVSDLTAKLNEAVAANITEQKKVEAEQRKKIVEELGAKLTQTDRQRFTSIAETIEAADVDTYRNKLTSIVENYIPAKPLTKPAAILNEAAPPVVEPERRSNSPMSQYNDTLRRWSLESN